MKLNAKITGLVVVVLSAANAGALTFEVAGRDVAIHGFVSQGYLKSTENNYLGESKDGTFDFTEYGVNASVFPLDDVYVGAQFYARKLGYWGSYKPDLDWGVVDYRFRDWLGFRVGRLKLPHGLYNETRDMDMLRTSVFLPQSIYNEAWREAFTALSYGGGIYGVTPQAVFGRLSYQLYYGKLDFDDDSGFVTYVGDQFGTDASNIENDDAWTFSLQWLPPVDGLRLSYTENYFGLKGDFTTWASSPEWAYVFGPGGGAPIDYAARPRVRAFSVEYIWDDLVLAAEYMRANQNYDLGVPGMGTISKGDPIMEAYYAGASYRFTDWFELGVSASVFYPNRDDQDGKHQGTGRPGSYNWLKDYALSGRFDITDNLIFKVEGHVMNGVASLPTRKNMDDAGNYTSDREWLLFMSKITYSF